MACYGSGSASATISLPNGTVDINGNSSLNCCYCAGGNQPPGELPILTCSDPAACNYNQIGTCFYPGKCDRYIRIRASMLVFYITVFSIYDGTCGSWNVSVVGDAELLSITDALGGQDYMRPGELLHYNYRIPGNSSGVRFTVNYFVTNSDLCRQINCGPTKAASCEAHNNPICGFAACDNDDPPGPVPSDNPGCFGHGGVILDLGSGEVIETVGIYGYSDIENDCYEEFLAPLTAFVTPDPQKTCECPSLVP